MNENRNKGIDGIKGIGCILIAFMWHYRHFGISMPSSIEYSSFIICRILRIGFEKGWLMVEIFFMISGYVIAFGYKRKIIDKLPFPVYIKKRVSVLWPPMVATLLCVTLLEKIYGGCFGEYFVYQEFGLKKFLLNLFMVDLERQSSFNGPSWYVCVLFVLYVIYYMQTRFLAINNIVYRLEAICLIAAGWAAYCRCALPLFRGMTCFYIGVVLAEVMAYIYSKIVIISWGVGGAVLLLAALEGKIGVRLQEVVIFYIGPLLLLAVCLSERLKLFLSKEFLLKLGEYSFIIYMWHFPVQLFIALLNRWGGSKMDYSSIGTWLIYCVLTFAWARAYREMYEGIRGLLKKWKCTGGGKGELEA